VRCIEFAGALEENSGVYDFGRTHWERRSAELCPTHRTGVAFGIGLLLATSQLPRNPGTIPITVSHVVYHDVKVDAQAASSVVRPSLRRLRP